MRYDIKGPYYPDFCPIIVEDERPKPILRNCS
jgi:hypothetical protein